MDRVKAYVDGFNLYHGLKAKHGHKYLWFDIEALVRRFVKSSQNLVAIEYFTARVRSQPVSAQRQATYLDALAAHCSLVTVVEGRFQQKNHRCWSCGEQWISYEEKETDVSIAVKLVEDGVQNVYDTFPPKRHSEELRKVTDGVLRISDATIRQAQLPESVVTDLGVSLKRPDYWT